MLSQDAAAIEDGVYYRKITRVRPEGAKKSVQRTLLSGRHWRRSSPTAESCRHMSLRRGPPSGKAHTQGYLASLPTALRRLRIICGIRIVLGYSRNEPANGERSQVCLQRVSNVLGIDFPFVHVERKGFQILFLLRWILDRRLRPLVERIVFRAVLFCRGDIIRKGIELAFRCSAILCQDIE